MRREALDVLEARHSEEEAQEAERSLLDNPRPTRMLFPQTGQLPESQVWLERLYASERMPRDKKSLVFDHLRSHGAWMVSVDTSPLCMLDGMSQTATLPFGFNADALIKAYLAGQFGDTLQFASDCSVAEHPAQMNYARTLQRLVPGFSTVCLVNSGAEANEKAFALCWANRRSSSQRRVLAFDGCFHGRTLLALHATANPAKRAAYELRGYEANFTPFAVCNSPANTTIGAPDALLERLASTEAQEVARSLDLGADDQLATDLAALGSLERWLQTGEHFACIIEPMQSEGGDRYGTHRFFQAVRVLTRKYQVPLIVDEVQTGFGLGGTFTWHQQFNLRTATGKPDRPDCVTFGKRAQLGVVMTCFADPEPSASHTASMVRGQLHAALLETDVRVARLEASMTARLHTLSQRYPELLLRPRVKGYALAFDLPTAAQCERYLSMRMTQGVMVFGAGDRTIRYRLSTAFSEVELESLFAAIDASLRALTLVSGRQPSKSAVPGLVTKSVEAAVRPRVRLAQRTELDPLLDAIMQLEQSVYEPARRDPRELLQKAFEHPDGLVAVAESPDHPAQVLGACLAVPLEAVAHIPGPDSDPNLSQDNTLYILTLVVDPRLRGTGLGRDLKTSILNQSRTLVNAAGKPRYLFQTGRNRIGHTEVVSNLNRSLGAYEVARLTGQYGEPDAQASYYRIHLQDFGIEVAEPGAPESERDLSQGISRPLANTPSTLTRALARGLLAGPAVTKLTLSNYVTPAAVRAVEWIGALCPALPHLYLTSSRDECIDKTLRCLRFHRNDAQIAIGLQGGYVGHTTAAARSLSDPGVHRAGSPFFDHWPLLPHPQAHSIEQTLAGLSQAVSQAGGAHQILGLVVEAVQERTGYVLDDAAWNALHDACQALSIPLVLVETASSYYRSGRGAFYSTPWAKQPDVLLWWAGGQQGFIHLASRYQVNAPLTMISTWDGDELSLIRAHHQLRSARCLDIDAQAARLDRALKQLASSIHARGAGMYRVLESKAEAGTLAAHLNSHGWHCRQYINDCISLAPALDVSDSTLLTLGKTLGNYALCGS